MTRWCIECAQQGQHQHATTEVDGDPLCDFHAKQAGGSTGSSEPVPAPAKKRGRPKGAGVKTQPAEPEAPGLELTKHEPEVAPAAAIDTHRVLWKARLSIQQRKDEFLFRASEEFGEASTIATDLLDSPPSCQMVGAVIVGIERVARLWN